MKFLAIADMHCSEKEATGTRLHTLSIGKLRDAINGSVGGCEFIMNFGDTAQSDEGYLPQVDLFRLAQMELNNSGKPYYSVIGNHDTATDKNTIVELMKMPGRYYGFDCRGYRCLVLDASLNAPDEPYPKAEIKWDECYIDTEQGEWLRQELEAAISPVLIFTHPPFALKEGWVEDLHLIMNRAEYMSLFQQSDKVKAVFSGHYHEGDCQVVSGIPYITFAAMCEGTDNSYSVVTVEDGQIHIGGFGNQPSYTCNIKE